MIVEVQGWTEGLRVCSVRLRHGLDPGDLLAERGFAVEAPLDASLVTGRASDDRVVVRLAVRPAPRCRPRPGPVGIDRSLLLAAGEAAVPVQRVGAYALVVGPRGVLATQHAATTNRAGTWGLPGGGLNRGEHPAEAARRECWEETGQSVEVGELLLVQTAHWVGRSPRGRAEDFHAVRLIYQGNCADPADPIVYDTDGTTAAAAWVAPEQVISMTWSTPAREQLTGLGLLPARSDGRG